MWDFLEIIIALLGRPDEQEDRDDVKNSAKSVATPKKVDSGQDISSTLDEKMIEQITNTLKSISTAELRGILLKHDLNEYTPEAFEAIKRILSLRE